jgi:hypothetical protein
VVTSSGAGSGAAGEATTGLPAFPTEQLEIEVARRMAECMELPFVDLVAYRVSPGILRKWPRDVLYRHRCVPIVHNVRRTVLVFDAPAGIALFSTLGLHSTLGPSGLEILRGRNPSTAASPGPTEFGGLRATGGALSVGPEGGDRRLEFALTTKTGLDATLARLQDLPWA